MRLLYFFLLIYISLLCIINGCDSKVGTDTQEFIKTVKSAKKQPVEPLPEEKLPEDSSYTGLTKRSPFVTSDEFLRNMSSNAGNINQPDKKREKEILENFNLSDLKMVGSLRRNDGSNWALIADSTGKVYKINNGNYIGQHYGKVKKVGEKSIEIEEAIENDNGTWSANTVIMNLKE